MIIGPDYPFWIAPALVIFFTLFTGNPGGPSHILLLKRTTKEDGKVFLSNPYSQVDTRSLTDVGLQVARHSHPGNMKEIRVKSQDFQGSFLVPMVAYFGHLISVSFDVKPPLELSARSLTPSSEAPSIIFQVYSVGHSGRKILEGYGYTHISDTAGSNEVDIKTWKPVGDTDSKLKVNTIYY